MDQRIYEFVDGWAAYFQTKRGWNLAKAKVWCSFVCFVFALAFANAMEHGRAFFLIFNGVLVGAGLWIKIKSFKEDGDYPESIRKCEHLNAKVLWNRDGSLKIGRRIWLFIFAVICLGNFFMFSVPKDIFWMIWGSAITFAGYLDCCFYLGPGKHSRELNRQEVTDAVTERDGV